MNIYIYIPGTPMTLILNGKGLLLEGSTTKIEDKQVPGRERERERERIHISELLLFFFAVWPRENKS